MIQVLSAAGHLVGKYAAFAIDLDGVVWRGERLIEGAVDGLQAIRRAGKPMLLLTNNGGYHPDEVVERLGEGGFDLKSSEVLTTTIVARDWIVNNGLKGAHAFILAPASVAVQLADLLRIRYIEAGQIAQIVLVGRDTDLNYVRLALAADAVRAGAEFLSLNKDPVMPVANGGMVPGTGSIVAALEAASGKSPIVLGKPQPPMMEAAADRLGSEGVLMIGDRIESDILGAQRMGWDSALVLTGLSTNTTAMEPEPTYVLQALSTLAEQAG